MNRVTWEIHDSIREEAGENLINNQRDIDYTSPWYNDDFWKNASWQARFAIGGELDD